MATFHISKQLTLAPARGQNGKNVNWITLWKAICAILVLCAAMTIAARAQTFTTLASFDGPNGETPSGPLIQGTDGNFYGTTSGGSSQYYLCLAFSSGCGTVFKVTPGGKLTTLHSFCADSNCSDGAGPVAGLILGLDGNFYGTTTGFGTSGIGGGVFKLTPSGALSTVFGLENAFNSNGLLQGIDGNFYVTTGSYFLDPGSISRLTLVGTLTTLYGFSWDSGQGAGLNRDGLIQGTDGNFYGTTQLGGNRADEPCADPDPFGKGCGTIFRVTPGGKLATLYSFCARYPCDDGDWPNAGLVQGVDGNFYGTTRSGGYVWGDCPDNRVPPYYIGCGTVFKITPGGTLTTIYNFCHEVSCSINGSSPVGGLVQATDGNFYGTTSGLGSAGGGTIFKITPSGNLTTLYYFCAQPNCTDGANPTDSLVQGTDGNLYGSTPTGGTNNVGTIFKVSLGLRPFARFIRDSGRIGWTAQILGQGFKGTTEVSFNGTPAVFTVKSDTYLLATVPAGATTGFVTVTTSSGTLKSNKIYRVLPQITSFSPTSGPADSSVVITGKGFTQTTAVSLDCKHPMSFTVDSDTQITAIVPAGSPSGKIGVTTVGGRTESAATFTVTP